MRLRRIKCCKCGTGFRLPVIWMMGVETVFRCPRCSTAYKTGFKMGAVLFGLALTLALVTANLLVWAFSSATLPVVVLLVVPLWLFYGLMLRRAWLMRKCRTNIRRKKSDDQ